MDNKIIIGIVAVVLLIAGVFFLMQPKESAPGGEVSGEGVEVPQGAAPSTPTTPEGIYELHMGMDPSSLGTLESIVNGKGDNYTRETALLVYSDIALRTENGDRALSFLKGIAYGEENDEVRNAAYSNYYWLKDEMGKAPNSTLEVAVNGELKTGNNITVLLTISTNRASELVKVYCLGQDLEEHYISSENATTVADTNSGKWAFAKAQVLPPDNLKTVLDAGVAREIPFTVYLKEPGQTIVKCALEVRYDRLDYDSLEKDVFLDISSSGGTYEIR